ncbi:hypothetical protein [uncultured Megasphaera sp.]|uniref:hypothetical protein n=1 Tax=uncultured Megasphaera sp. TaxID=165188 RepID=UPI00266C98FF|nr:hypothetical protein [uncultured Megasphaera sp.]
MIASNVAYYAAGFDKAGRRVAGKICDFDPNKSKDANKIAALLEEIKSLSDDVVVAEIINAEDYVEYLGGKIRGTDGRPTEYIPPELTPEEQRSNEAASIAEKYTPQLSDLKDSLITAALTGDVELQEEIKAEYAELMEEYNTELEAL